jgi:hypothetical protein
MTKSPDDHIDPYESRLTRRVDAFAEQAVRPIDAAAIAAAAHAGARRQSFVGRLFGSNSSIGRLGLVVAAALLAAGSIGVYIAGGAPAASDNPPVETPIATTGRTPDCAAKNLSAEIVGWEGAAGHRIATVRFRDLDLECLIPTYLKPALVDGAGHALIVGGEVPEAPPIHLSVGTEADALVDMTNYCGPAPIGEVILRIYLPSNDSVEARRSSNLNGPLDAPPCNGPTVPASIEMQGLGTIPGT